MKKITPAQRWQVVLSATLASGLLIAGQCKSAAHEPAASTKVIGFRASGDGQIGNFDLGKDQLTLDPHQPDCWQDNSLAYNLNSGRATTAPTDHGDCIELQSVCGVPGKSVYCAAYHGRLYEVDEATGLAHLVKLPVEGQVKAIAWDSKRDRLAVLLVDELQHEVRWWCRDSRGWDGSLVIIPHQVKNDVLTDVSAMAYDEAENAFYLLFAMLPLSAEKYPCPKSLGLAKVTAQGKLVDLGHIKGDLSIPHCGKPLQLIRRDNSLILIAPTPSNSNEMRLYTIALRENGPLVEKTAMVETKPPLQKVCSSGFREYFLNALAPPLRKTLLSATRAAAKVTKTGLVHLKISKDGKVIACNPMIQTSVDENLSNTLSSILRSCPPFAPFPADWPDSINLDLALVQNDHARTIIPVVVAE